MGVGAGRILGHPVVARCANLRGNGYNNAHIFTYLDMHNRDVQASCFMKPWRNAIAEHMEVH